MANHYERNIEIIRRFHLSWTDTESRFNDLIENHQGFDRLKPLRKFIENLKCNERNNFFRLRTSMTTLIISRSVDQDLRMDQKQIQIEAIDISDFEVTLKDGEKIYRQYRLGNLEDMRLSQLLATLKHTLID